MQLPIIIAGSRTLKLKDYDFLKQTCIDIISKEQYVLEIPNKNLIIVSGKEPKGADYLGEKFAKEFNLTVKEFPAQWYNMEPPVIVGNNHYGEYNKLAGPKRNLQMAEYVMIDKYGILIAFDAGTKDKSSSGTKDMIKVAKKNFVKVYHVKCEARDNVKIKIYNGDDYDGS